MPQVKRSRQALRDLAGIVRYISTDNPSAADRWLHEIEEVFSLMASAPEMGERLETRRFGLLRRHVHGNYVIYYRPRSYGVFILRVLHGARDHGRII